MLDNSFVSVSRSLMTCCGVCSILLMEGGKKNGARGNALLMRKDETKDGHIKTPPYLGEFTCRAGLMTPTAAQQHQMW